MTSNTSPAMALDQFLRTNAAAGLDSWADVDGDTAFPIEDAPVPVWVTRARGGFDGQRLAELVKQGLPGSYDDVADLALLLRGLEEARKVDFEDWMVDQQLDLVAFPAAGGVGRDDLFISATSLEEASRNGIVYSNGNRVFRHLGIPTVTVPMGFMADIQMPVGITFAGAAYTDDRLLDYVWAYERATRRREPAFLTPTLPSNQIDVQDSRSPVAAVPAYSVSVERGRRSWDIQVQVSAPSSPLSVWADGHILRPVAGAPGVYRGAVSLARKRLAPDIMVVVKAGNTVASMHFELLPATPPAAQPRSRTEPVDEQTTS